MAKKNPNPKPDTETPDTEAPKDFTEIGGSPVPGLTLRHVLRGHKEHVCGIAWSPDGRRIASPSEDKTIQIWNIENGKKILSLSGHTGRVNAVSWSTQPTWLASSSDDKTIKIWNTNDGEILHSFAGPGNNDSLLSWSRDGRLLGFYKDKSIYVYHAENGESYGVFNFSQRKEYNPIFSPDGWYFIKNIDNSILMLDVTNGQWYRITDISLANRQMSIYSTSFSPATADIALGCDDNKVRIFNLKSNQQIELEGHTGRVLSVSFSYDGTLLASKGGNQVIIWDTNTWKQSAQVNEGESHWWPPRLAFNPVLPILASLGENDCSLRIWDIDRDVLLSNAPITKSINYTTAKLVLVGDSGVGKTGLGWRLAHGEFKEHASTHGQQFWSIPELGLKRKDGTDCEAVLWDLAGQHVYRQVHSIFLENVAAALVLFDPSNRQDPLKGAQFWLEELKDKGKLPPTVLIGARVDRGAPALSQADLDQFCQRYGITGGYLSTSAMSGEGLDALLEKLKTQIPWDEMTATVTTVTFKRIKDYVLSLKEKTDRKGVLVSPQELRAQLEQTFRVSQEDSKESKASKTLKVSDDWEFTNAEMMTAVGHLETHGYVSVLHNSAGETYILLTPELLVNIAASIMLLADKNSRELGAVSETDLLGGKIPFNELKGLEQSEGQILLDAAILRFLEHSICFRETLGSDTLLIFPSLIKQKRPLQDDLPATDDISYVVRGRVENLYASLVVLLGYTPSFMRINQWQNQAQYEMGAGEVCGFRMIEEREGEIELVLYYDDKMPVAGREKYQELFEQFLYQRDVEVTRFPPVICKNGHQQKRATVIDRVREGKTFVFCDECGDKTILPDFEKPQTIGIGASAWLQVEEATARLRSSYEVHLTRVKSYRRTWATPSCYVSRLPNDAEWSGKLIHDLQDAGIFIIENAEQVKPEDFLILVDTSAYRKAYQSSLSVLAADSQLVKSRLKHGNKKVFALACEGNSGAHTFKNCTSGEFCDETHYPVSLFDLVLNLYAIPFNHAGFAPLRQKLHEQWENTLAGKKKNDMTALKIFISYSHKDEPFKDELVTMLAGLQRRGIVDAWHDRRIEAGDEWYKSIQDAMDDCDLALLLVSPDYLASRFIQEDEQPKLLKRREEMKARVMPIIIRPCIWQSEETISILQVMPKDGKAVITFSKENGDRDQAWADIASVIEKRAKAKATL